MLDRFSGESALYDLAKDPGEKRDVQQAAPAVTAALREELDRFMSREPIGEPRPLPEFTEEELQSLRELGYL